MVYKKLLESVRPIIITSSNLYQHPYYAVLCRSICNTGRQQWHRKPSLWSVKRYGTVFNHLWRGPYRCGNANNGKNSICNGRNSVFNASSCGWEYWPHVKEGGGDLQQILLYILYSRDSNEGLFISSNKIMREKVRKGWRVRVAWILRTGDLGRHPWRQ